MKEVHAYLNEDDTYRIHIIGEEYISDQLCTVKGFYPRAIIKIEALEAMDDKSSNEMFTLEIDDDDELL